MSAQSNLSQNQFNFVVKKHGNHHTIELHDKDNVLGYADVEHSDDHTYLNYLKSNVENQGHARRIMEHVYKIYKGPVDWGYTLNPASTHLAESFSDNPTYGSRTYHDGPLDIE